MGGRGQSANGNKHYKMASGRATGFSESLHPAIANTRIKSKTVEGAMAEFRNRYKDANREWSYTVDKNGYVYAYTKGSKDSVQVNLSRDTRSKARIRSDIKNDDHSRADLTVLHNHPGGAAYSKQDLRVTAQDHRIKTMVASGSKYDYVFTKGTQFKGKEFDRVLDNATMTGKDYSEAVHNWLTKNQKKYHYKYYRRKNS